MKIKLYKLLEMIDRGEELPEKVKFEKDIYTLVQNTYLNVNDYGTELIDYIGSLYDTCEIAKLEIEIVEDTKIEPLEINENEDNLRIKSESGNWLSINSTDRVLAHKINEIIKVINKEGKDE